VNDLEDRVRQELRWHAGSEPFRPMPTGTPRRVHRRQARAVVAAALTVLVVVAAGVSLARVIPGGGETEPAGTGTPSANGYVAPSPSFGPWPVVTFGGDFTPYLGPDNGTHRTVIAYGRVDGIPWSEVAYRGEGLASRCLGLSVRKDGGTFCPDTVPPTPPGIDLDSLGAGASGPIGYWGVVAPTVASLEVRLDDGESRPIRILPGPAGAGNRYFVLFPPPRAPGTVVAMDADGNVIGHLPLCSWDAAQPTFSHPCSI